MKKKECEFGCGRLAEHKKSGICHACYQFIYYWRKKSVTEVVKYGRRLEFFSERVRKITRPRAVHGRIKK